jgi:hypothetical protein
VTRATPDCILFIVSTVACGAASGQYSTALK